MKSVKEMREICQKPREWCDTWQGKHVSRRFSIYITRILLKMGVTPNMATVIFLFSIFVPCIFFGIGSRASILIGTLFLQLWYILDHVDGEIARYKNLSTTTGFYFDSIVHYIAHPLIFASLGYGLVQRYHQPCVYLFASSGTISIVLISIVSDLKKTILFETGKSKSSGNGEREKVERYSLSHRIFSLIHKTCTIPHMMNIITFAAILDVFFGSHLVLYSVIYLGIAMPVVWAGKLAQTVITKELDKT